MDSLEEKILQLARNSGCEYIDGDEVYLQLSPEFSMMKIAGCLDKLVRSRDLCRLSKEPTQHIYRSKWNYKLTTCSVCDFRYICLTEIDAIWRN